MTVGAPPVPPTSSIAFARGPAPDHDRNGLKTLERTPITRRKRTRPPRSRAPLRSSSSRRSKLSAASGLIFSPRAQSATRKSP